VTRILKPGDLDHVVEAYLRGETPRELGERYGVQAQSILARLRKAGVKTRGVAEAKAARLPPLDSAVLVARYQKGESVNAIAQRFGVSRRAIERRLLSEGVELRSQSEAERVKWARMPALRRAEQVAAAHAAARVKLRGRQPSIASRIAKSLAWEREGALTWGEFCVSLCLCAGHLDHTAQKSVRTYNIDLALEAECVAVEVLSSRPDRVAGAALRKKLEYLFDRGWFVLFVALDPKAPGTDFDAITRDLVAWTERARRGKALAGKYGMIRCHPQLAAATEKYLDGFAHVEGP